MTILFVILALSYLLLGYVTSRAVLHIATRKNILDLPNERSSHTTPIPRLGGIGFVTVICINLIVELVGYSNSSQLKLALFIPPLLISTIGLADDIYNLSNKIRFCLQIILSSIVVILVSPIAMDTTWLMAAISLALIIAIVWLINLFNFMDGIDGIAGAEAVFILLALALFFWLQLHQRDWPTLMFLSAMPVAGFLILNWSPAKIFMGDVGSTYLGLFIGTSMLIAIKFGVSIWSCLILAGVFLVDTSWTLVTRIITGQQWFRAHRSHAYQKLAAKYSHSQVSLGVTIINILWLLPLALMAYYQPAYALVAVSAAYIPLVILCVKTKAGLN